MAIINLKDVQISRLFWGSKAAEVVERFNVSGKPVEKKYTLWFEEPQTFAEGSIIDVSGLLKVEVKEFQPQDAPEPVRFAQVSINKPKVTVTQSPADPKLGHAAINQVWPSVASAGVVEPGDGAPF